MANSTFCLWIRIIGVLILGAETVGGVTYAIHYTYDEDGRITSAGWTTGNTTVTKELHYDDLDRQTASVLSSKTGEQTVPLLNTSYVYQDTPGFGSSHQVSAIQYRGAGYANLIAYGYDKNGNITKAGDVSYEYDEAGQLTRVNDPRYGTTVYVYDVGGNIKYVKSYDYTVGELGACTATVTYGYDSTWKDKLISYNGQTITYDGAGNPLTYRNGMSFTWEMGRQLATLSAGNTTYTYRYNADGLRTETSDGTTTTRYTWADGRITSQSDGTNLLYFRYDDQGTPLSLVWNGTEYYYVTNLQGDIIALLDGQGNCVVEYTYDAWGKLLSTTGTLATSLGKDNPLRYRGYYYDSDAGLYYLQSRYYDPVTGRFLNADDISYLGASGTTLSHNLFAYCENNPVNCVDTSGFFGTPIQWVFAAIGAVAGWFLGDYVAKKLGFKSGWKYWAIRAGVVVGGAVIGWFAASVLTAIIKGFIFSSPKLIASTPLWVYKFLGIATGSGSVVLGKYPLYVSLAEKLGSSIFQVANSVWKSMSASAQWAANKAFLDKVIASGQKITLQTNAYSKKVTGFFAKEIQYLLQHGYKIIQGGWGMGPK